VIWVDWNPEDGKGLDDLKVAGILESVLEEAFNNFGDPDLQGGKPHFWSTPERGLLWESYKKIEETGEFKKSLTTIGNHLVAIAYVDNVDRNGASIYIEFKTQRNQIVRWLLPRKDLVGNSEIIAELLARGYWYRVRGRAQLVEYLIGLGSDIEKTYTITDRTGWVNKSFVLPNRTYGDETLKFKDIEPIKDTAFECKGTLEDWKSNVAALATGNSRLIFALGCAFSAPLAPLLEVESGGFHLFGATSTGKTSTLKLASSVMGIPNKAIQRWRATANGLEGLAVAHNHLLLPLDEIGQADPRDVGNAAYMLANGQGKTRANRTGDRIVPKTWNLQYLSTGEITLTNYLKSANIAVKGGQEIRMLDLPACPVGGNGVLDSIGKFATAADFIRELDIQCDRHCGTALDTFLNQLTQDAQSPEWVKTTKARLWEIATKLSKIAPSDEVIGRVSLRFALVQTALEVAHSYGLLPFPIEQISWAIATMQTDWLNTRGGVGSLEMKQALERIENLFVVNQHNNDRIYQVGEAETNQGVRNLLAYRKLDTFDNAFEFWVPNAVFNSEIAKDCDRSELIQELQRKGWIKPSGADGKPYLGRRVNGKKLRVYVFTQFWSDENLGTDFEDIQKVRVPEVPQVPEAENIDGERVLDGTQNGFITGSSGFQRFQSHDEQIKSDGNSTLITTQELSVEPVEPQENAVGSSEGTAESIANTSFTDGGTSGTRGTYQNKETLKIGSQVKYFGNECKVARDKKLTIVSIDGDIAKVTSKGWVVEQSLSLSELVEAIA
jgi:putative DNA primase/helicase